MRNNGYNKRMSGGDSVLASLFEQDEDIIIEIGFDTSNASFEENYEAAFNDIIDNVAYKIKSGIWESKILDLNGNTIGSYLVTEKERDNDK